MDRRLDRMMNGRTLGWMDGRTDSHTDRRTDGQERIDKPENETSKTYLSCPFTKFPSASRDALDDLFQRTLDVLTGIERGYLNL